MGRFAADRVQAVFRRSLYPADRRAPLALISYLFLFA